ncbi:MAG: hypothetical protein K2L87_02310, partial [Clostridiales bacterium]|nr:hypothetical protein [Clostridiales bacterium]
KVVKSKIEVLEKLGEETQIYCDLDYMNDRNTVVDNAAQMIAKISSRAVVNLGEVVELAFDAHHIHLFDGETEATMLERDEHYDVIPENAEGSAFVPPTPQEMKAQIEAARVITKEMKKQQKRDEKMARINAAKQAESGAAPAEAPVEAPVETPVAEAPIAAPVVEEPVVTPVEAPVEAPAPEAPAPEELAPAEAPAEKPAKAPAAKKPASKPAAKPANKPTSTKKK